MRFAFLVLTDVANINLAAILLATKRRKKCRKWVSHNRSCSIKICYIACFLVSWFSCGLFYMAVRLYHNRKNCIFFQSFNTKNFAFSCYYVIFALVWQSSKRQLESAYTQIFANRASIKCLFITTISPRWTSS